MNAYDGGSPCLEARRGRVGDAGDDVRIDKRYTESEKSRREEHGRVGGKESTQSRVSIKNISMCVLAKIILKH